MPIDLKKYTVLGIINANGGQYVKHLHDGKEYVHPVIAWIFGQHKDSKVIEAASLSFDEGNTLSYSWDLPPGEFQGYFHDRDRYNMFDCDTMIRETWLRETAGLSDQDVKGHINARLAELFLDQLARESGDTIRNPE